MDTTVERRTTASDQVTTFEAQRLRSVLCAVDDTDVERALQLLAPFGEHFWGSWPRDLRLLAELGADAPTWVWCRAAVDQAHRWSLVEARSLVDAALLLVLDQTDPAGSDDEAARELRWHRAALLDGLVRDRLVFDCERLWVYLRSHATDDLAARARMLRRWANAELSVFCVEDLTGDRLVVTDEVSRLRHRVLHLGAVVGVGPESRLLGRVAPIAEPPGEVFVSRPLELDSETAAELVVEWRRPAWDAVPRREPLLAIGRAVRDGRVPARPGIRARSISLLSDLAPADPDLLPPAVGNASLSEVAGPGAAAGPGGRRTDRAHELMAHGLPSTVAEQVAVVEMVVELVADPRLRSQPDIVAILAHHAASALEDRTVREAVREAARTAATPEVNAESWSSFARCLPEPTRSFCLEMAALRSAA